MVSYARSRYEEPAAAASEMLATAPDAGDPLHERATASTFGKVIAVAFIISLIIPVYFTIASMRLSPYRVILLLSFIPTLGIWMSGKAGRLRTADFLLIGFCLWSMLATVQNNGFGRFQFSAMYVVETLGAYMLGRVLVRDLNSFLVVTRTLFWVLLFLIPFAAIESYTAKSFYLSLFKVFGQTIAPSGYDPRLGLDRAQVAFDHPILYGVFASSTFSLLYFMPRRKDPLKVAGLWRAFASLGATFFSLSSGAFIPIGMQLGLIAWDRILTFIRWRWKLLVGLFVLAYVTVDMLSNRTPFQVFASMLAFNGSTYYWRVLIYQYGMQNVWADPLFGFGLGGNWVRPSWMATSTVDNHWLLMAMRYGIPGFLLIFGTYVTIIISLIRAKISSQVVANQRQALIFAFIGTGIAMSTVFLWNSVYVHLMFLLGASMWICDWEDNNPETAVAAEAPDTAPEPQEPATISMFTRQKRDALKRHRDSGSTPAPAREPRKYSRVEPRRAQDNRHKRNPYKRH